MTLILFVSASTADYVTFVATRNVMLESGFTAGLSSCQLCIIIQADFTLVIKIYFIPLHSLPGIRMI